MSIRTFIHAWTGGTLQIHRVAGRLLIALSLLLLAATPFTERLWSFDGFLRGGQDLEFSLLALILFFCLVLLLAQSARHGLSAILTLRRRLRLVLHWGRQAALASAHRSIPNHPSQWGQLPPICSLAVPLRI